MSVEKEIVGKGLIELIAVSNRARTSLGHFSVALASRRIGLVNYSTGSGFEEEILELLESDPRDAC